MIEMCLCIFTLAASAALLKLACWLSNKADHEKEKDKVSSETTRAIYIFKTSNCFHVVPQDTARPNLFPQGHSEHTPIRTAILELSELTLRKILYAVFC